MTEQNNTDKRNSDQIHRPTGVNWDAIGVDGSLRRCL